MHTAIEQVVTFLKKYIPRGMVRALRRPYHFFLSALSASAYGFPAREMTVIGINGTKGKSTTAEMVFHIIKEAGHTPLLASTIRFAVGNESVPNQFKMTMAGRGFLQKFLSEGKKKGATHAVVEITSEGARDSRHRFLFLDGLIMLNVQKEHIESFGSFEKYVGAKWWIVRELERSKKKNRAIVVSTDDPDNATFLGASVPVKIPFSKKDLAISEGREATTFIFENDSYTIPLPGAFNATNAVAAILICEHIGIPRSRAREALQTLPPVRGRVESISLGQPFSVIVDYAHTPDSLRALYGAFKDDIKICVLGNTGGGRDKWKRPEMGAIADSACDTVILTNEDPYDEDPEEILREMQKEMRRAPRVIIDRRGAIREGILRAKKLSREKKEAHTTLLISGKGTDPFIMGPGGTTQPWSDAEVVREELAREGYGQ